MFWESSSWENHVEVISSTTNLLCEFDKRLKILDFNLFIRIITTAENASILVAIFSKSYCIKANRSMLLIIILPPVSDFLKRKWKIISLWLCHQVFFTNINEHASFEVFCVWKHKLLTCCFYNRKCWDDILIPKFISTIYQRITGLATIVFLSNRCLFLYQR